MTNKFAIRNARPEEFSEIGRLLVNVYSQLEGFPKTFEQPAYYKMLESVGDLTKQSGVEILIAASQDGHVKGAVVYFADMAFYGSGGSATKEKGCGFRLLAVRPDVRGKGLGKLLTIACIEKARFQRQEQIIIHTTKAMQMAWKMYERLGFQRSSDLDFMQGDLNVYGFRLLLQVKL